MNLLRREFLRSITSFAGILLLGSARATVRKLPRIAWPSTASIGDVRRQTDELKEMLNSGFHVLVKKGAHQINGGIVCTAKNVAITGMLGSSINVLQPNRGGLRFVESESVTIRNIKLNWSGVGFPKRSHYGAGVLFFRCQNPVLRRISIVRAPGAGVHFDECHLPTAISIEVRMSGADGVHFANCSDSVARNIYCEDTGDDSIAFVDYKKKPQGEGFRLTNAHIIRSRSRGIALVGACKGSVAKFKVLSSASNGLHIEQDAHYETRSPWGIKVSRGEIYGAGLVLPLQGNQFGINVLRASDIDIKNVQVETSLGAGISIVNSRDVKITDTSCQNSSAVGIALNNSSVSLSRVKVSKAAVEGLRAIDCSVISVASLKIDSIDRNPKVPVLLLRGNVNIDMSGINILLDSKAPANRVVMLEGKQRGKIVGTGVRKEEILNRSPDIAIYLKP